LRYSMSCFRSVSLKKSISSDSVSLLQKVSGSTAFYYLISDICWFSNKI